MDEVWKPVVGYETLYEVSDHGRVRRVFVATKISHDDFIAIKNAFAQGQSKNSLAQQYHVTIPAISVVMTYQGRFSFRTPYRLLKLILTRTGYHEVGLCKDGKRKSHHVHRLVAKTFIDPIPEGWTVNHKNGIRTDNHVTNLEIMTLGDNIRHAFRELNPPPRPILRGSAQPMAKLVESDIPTIYRLRSEGLALREIGARFGVSLSTISLILKEKIWKHIPRPSIEA